MAQHEAEGDAAVRNESIVLSVPGSTAKDVATYRSTLTWELSALPDNEPDEETETV
ncbi:WxL domain-containing protein [Enterococcus mundtii]|nr:WxL domain-containing protein [Enterococcus mundtii]